MALLQPEPFFKTKLILRTFANVLQMFYFICNHGLKVHHIFGPESVPKRYSSCRCSSCCYQFSYKKLSYRLETGRQQSIFCS